ncbi:CST complex subunit TEN1 [Turdus rufiventris]|nr:CST complex subunit TEN1 [Turdus rufiventris]
MCMELRRESARHMRHRHGVVSYISSSLNAVGLCCYDLAQSEAVLTTQHNSAQYKVCVDTKFVEPFQAQVGSFYMVLGEVEHREETSSPVVKARILTCVEGVNVPLLEQAIQEQRKYFNERQEQREKSTS